MSGFNIMAWFAFVRYNEEKTTFPAIMFFEILRGRRIGYWGGLAASDSQPCIFTTVSAPRISRPSGSVYDLFLASNLSCWKGSDLDTIFKELIWCDIVQKSINQNCLYFVMRIVIGLVFYMHFICGCCIVLRWFFGHWLAQKCCDGWISLTLKHYGVWGLRQSVFTWTLWTSRQVNVGARSLQHNGLSEYP